MLSKEMWQLLYDIAIVEKKNEWEFYIFEMLFNIDFYISCGELGNRIR